ncbi:MAG TPA: nucleoside transporter C-terminal domain-containing protein [Vicinamibacterales bacterium]|nr:nucleoside transporter C-terminal domain-containing protein [Vicinamibacterales bacterium]
MDHTAEPGAAPAPGPAVPRTDGMLRLAAAALALVIAIAVYVLQNQLSANVRGGMGIVAFIAIVAAFSTNLKAVSWRTVAFGMGIQLALALMILKLEFNGWRPGYAFFAKVGAAVKQFLEFTNAGSTFVFGGLADPAAMSAIFPGGFVFAFVALPTVIFVSSFFTVLYYFGVLQFIVKLFAKAMMYLMRTSGAETLAAAANVFMGQTEAPIIVKPYVPRMTQSELLAMMVGGMATISGGVMAVYIALGADPVAILTTSVMAAPCGLYLAKILLPETEEPETRGDVKTVVERQHVNVVDAAAAGASDGLMLALNIAAMLIAFLAFIAMFDYILGMIRPGLSLPVIFSWLFAPLALMMGVPVQDAGAVGDLLGTKLVANEFVAYVKLTSEYRGLISDRAYTLSTFALTGFANFASIGILLGGIGAMAPSRRGDLARLGMKALLGGFLATMINASIAAMLLG